MLFSQGLSTLVNELTAAIHVTNRALRYSIAQKSKQTKANTKGFINPALSGKILSLAGMFQSQLEAYCVSSFTEEL